MNAEAKLDLINLIAKSENELLLNEIKVLLELAESDIQYQLSSDQIEALKVAENQINYGNVMTNDEAQEATEKWFKK